MRRIIVFIAFLSALSVTAQQDPHFSMWQATPSIVNSAATGAMGEDYSFFAGSRAQWLGSVSKPFLTSIFSAETKVLKDRLASGWFGTGLIFTDDETGKANIGTISAYVPINYVMELSDRSIFSVGFKPGFINRQINSFFQTWDNQWNGIAFDRTFDNPETSPRKFTQFDMGAGL